MRLIVANQTLGGVRLQRTVRERIAEGQRSFYVLVPMVEPRSETQVWAAGDVSFVLPPLEEELAEAVEVARLRSERRLELMVEAIEAAGGAADGEVGEHDPVSAVRRVLEERGFEEIIVSTLPGGISRWLGLDLPSRVARMTDTPVTTVEAEHSRPPEALD